MTDRPHNASTYTNHRCRCSVCRADHAAEVKRRRDERLAVLAPSGGWDGTPTTPVYSDHLYLIMPVRMPS